LLSITTSIFNERKLWRETHKKENIHSITTKKICLSFYFCVGSVFSTKKPKEREKI